MDLGAHQIANRRIHQAVSGEGRQTDESARADEHVEMPTTAGGPCMTRVQRAVVADVELLRLEGGKPRAQGLDARVNRVDMIRRCRGSNFIP